MVKALLISQVEAKEDGTPAHVREPLQLVKLDAARRIPHLDIDLTLVGHRGLVVHVILGRGVLLPICVSLDWAPDVAVGKGGQWDLPHRKCCGSNGYNTERVSQEHRAYRQRGKNKLEVPYNKRLDLPQAESPTTTKLILGR